MAIPTLTGIPAEGRRLMRNALATTAWGAQLQLAARSGRLAGGTETPTPRALHTASDTENNTQNDLVRMPHFDALTC